MFCFPDCPESDDHDPPPNLSRISWENPIVSETTPSILRKASKRKFILIRDPNSVLKPAGSGETGPQNVVARVQCASTSNDSFLTSPNEASTPPAVKPVTQVAYRTYVRVPPERRAPTRVKEEVLPIAGSEGSQKPVVRRILVKRSIPLCGTARDEGTQGQSTPGTPMPGSTTLKPVVTARDHLMPDASDGNELPPIRPIQVEPIPTEPIKSEAPDEFIADNYTPLSESTESAFSGFESSGMNMDFADVSPTNRCSGVDQHECSDIMDDFLDDMLGNVSRDSEGFYMVSHESLMEVLSTCNICASAADVSLHRKGTTCEAHIKCRKTAKHDAFWDGEKCRKLGSSNSGREASTSPNSQMLNPYHDVPWSLIWMCLIARIVDIPIKKLEQFCRLLFAPDHIRSKLQVASSLAASFPLIHGVTKPTLEKPMDHLKLIVVCRKLLVFLDPFNYSPLACFEFPGRKLLSTSDLSSALNIGLQRLQLVNSNKFASVDVVHMNASGEDACDWKPILVPDMDLMFLEAFTSLHVALWQNNFEFDIKSSQLRGILDDISKALCFFQPDVARMSAHEGRAHYSRVLRDLSEIYDCRYIPRIGEITLLRKSLQSLTCANSKTQIETLIREVERLDVYQILNPLYEKIISTADASYVVSIRSEEPCRATYNVMRMIERSQEEELSLENALRVLLLLPVGITPIDVIENICGSH